jgi:predicted O-methyltransferase YrrM
MSLVKKYIIHLWKSFHPKGAGIHSPFVFKLVTKVINNNTKYNCYKDIEKERKKLSKNRTMLNVVDYGIGSNHIKSNKKQISKIAKFSLKPKKQAQLLFRLIKHLNPNNILEIGTSLGITTCYMAKAANSANIITLEGCPEISKISQDVFNNLEITNITQYTGEFSSTIPKAFSKLETLDFVFFDGNHNKKSTINYFKQCLPFINNNTIFIFDDIHQSDDMEEAWDTIKNHLSVKITIDLFHMGIVVFKKELSKQNFFVRI